MEDPKLHKIEKPQVMKEGELVDHKPDLKGKTKEVYQYLLQQTGPNGIRDIQRILSYSSPSVVSYHLNNLMELGLVFKNEEGKYYVTLEEEKSVLLNTHFRIASYWVPRMFSYAITLLFMQFGAIYLTIIDYTKTKGWALLTIPVLSIVIIMLLLDSRRVVQNYQRVNQE